MHELKTSQSNPIMMQAAGLMTLTTSVASVCAHESLEHSNVR